MFNLIILSSTCFEHTSVSPQKKIQDDILAIDQTTYMDPWKKYHKTARTSLPEDEHLNVQNLSKTL